MKIEVSSNISEVKQKAIQTGLLAYGFSITKDNKKFCYTNYNTYSNLWIYNFDERKKFFKPKKLTEGTSIFEMPVISPDGKEIAFVYKGNINKMSVNGDSIKQLTFSNSYCSSPSWSPKGKEIAYISKSKLFTISSEGGTPSLISNYNVGPAAYWVTDSEIYYQKLRNRNFYIYNIITKEKKILVSNDSLGWMFNPNLSPDSLKLVVFWNRKIINNSGLWIISLKDSSQKLIVRNYYYVPLGWSNDGRWIYSLNMIRDSSQILMVSTDNGATKIIYTLPAGKVKYHNDIDMSYDWKKIVCVLFETNSDVWMIENFDPDVE